MSEHEAAGPAVRIGGARDDRPSDHEAGERVVDALIALMGARYRRTPDSPYWTTPWFVEWRARKAATTTRQRGEGLSEAALDAVVASVQASALARRLSMVRERSWPGEQPPPAGPLADALDQAALERCAVRVDLGVAAGAGREMWDEAPESKVPLPAGVAPGRYVVITVRGASMEPLLHDGDALLVRLGEDVRRDTVVVARTPDDGYVVKRVGGVGRYAIELMSLNASFPPVRIPRRPGSILGTVVMSWCGGTTTHATRGG